MVIRTTQTFENIKTKIRNKIKKNIMLFIDIIFVF